MPTPQQAERDRLQAIINEIADLHKRVLIEGTTQLDTAAGVALKLAAKLLTMQKDAE